MGREVEGNQEGADFKAPTAGEAKNEWGETEGEASVSRKGKLWDTHIRIQERMKYLLDQNDTEEEVTFEGAGREVALKTAIDSAKAIASEKGEGGDWHKELKTIIDELNAYLEHDEQASKNRRQPRQPK